MQCWKLWLYTCKFNNIYDCVGQKNGLPKRSMFQSPEFMILCYITKVSYSDKGKVTNHFILKQEDFPGLSRWAKCNHKCPYKREAEVMGCKKNLRTIVGFEDEKMPKDERYGQLLQMRK